jgi:hypothetical protein
MDFEVSLWTYGSGKGGYVDPVREDTWIRNGKTRGFGKGRHVDPVREDMWIR